MGQVGVACGGLLGVKLLTQVIDTSEFGRLMLANTIMTLIGINFFGPFGQGIMRFWAICKERGNVDALYKITGRFTRYTGIAGIFGIIISCLLLVAIKNRDWIVLLMLSLITGAVTGLSDLRISALTAMRRRKHIAILQMTNAFLKPLLAVFLIVLTIAKANVAILGYLLAAFFVFSIAHHLYSRAAFGTYLPRHKPDPDIASLQSLNKELLSFCWPFLTWGIFGWIHSSCDRWALQTFHGSDIVGAFAVVSQLAVYPINFASEFFTTLFMPIAFQKAGDIRYKHSINSANKTLLTMTIVYVSAAAALLGLSVILHRPLILLISNERFAELSYLLPGLTAAWALFYLGQVLSQFGLLSNKTKLYIAPKITVSVIAALAVFYLSFRMGASGVMIGLLLAGAIYSLWCGIIGYKLVRSTDLVNTPPIMKK